MRVRRSIGRTLLNGRQPMSFFSNITSVFHSTENTETPVSATFASRKDTVYAPSQLGRNAGIQSSEIG